MRWDLPDWERERVRAVAAPKVVLANADLRLRSGMSLPDPTPEQNERIRVIFDMLISLFERAYLVAYKGDMSETEARRMTRSSMAAVIFSTSKMPVRPRYPAPPQVGQPRGS